MPITKIVVIVMIDNRDNSRSRRLEIVIVDVDVVKRLEIGRDGLNSQT